MEPGIHATVPENQEEFWLATCRLFGDQSSVICDVEFGYRDYYLRVALAGPNLHLRVNIKEFIISYLDQWRADCI
jgi:hypothetical protein